jgi:hypothetical protein
MKRAKLDLRPEDGSRTSSFVRGVECNVMALVASHRCKSHRRLNFFFFLSPAVLNCDHLFPTPCRQLTFPGVPASIPEQFTNLTSLESLTIVGDGNSPGMA